MAIESNRGWKVLFTMLFVVGSFPLHAWAVQFYWDTFVVAAVPSVRPIGLVHALALSAFARMVTYSPKPGKTPDTPWGQLCQWAAVLCVTPLMAIGIGLLYRRWM